jgi:hypothetical protein
MRPFCVIHTFQIKKTNLKSFLNICLFTWFKHTLIQIWCVPLLILLRHPSSWTIFWVMFGSDLWTLLPVVLAQKFKPKNKQNISPHKMPLLGVALAFPYSFGLHFYRFITILFSLLKICLVKNFVFSFWKMKTSFKNYPYIF